MIDETENQDLTEDEKQLLKQLSEDLPALGAQRRHFLKQVTALTGGILALQMFSEESLFATPLKPAPALSALSIENGVQVAFTVNTIPASLQARRVLSPNHRSVTLSAERQRMRGLQVGDRWGIRVSLVSPSTCDRPSTATRKSAIAGFGARPHIGAKHGPDARPAPICAEPTD